MGEREFEVLLPGSSQDRYRHYHVTEKGKVLRFVIQYEALIKNSWRAIVRYDTAHGFPHKDTMHPDGSETKVPLAFLSTGEALTLGQEDIWNNWRTYREQYEREMGK